MRSSMSAAAPAWTSRRWTGTRGAPPRGTHATPRRGPGRDPALADVTETAAGPRAGHGATEQPEEPRETGAARGGPRDRARRTAIGLEASATTATAAAAQGAVTRGDAHALPFRDAAFGGARADRVLQHMADPLRVLAEMARVARRGGRVVAADPDQETLVIEVPGVRRSVLDRLTALRRDVGDRNGRLAASLPAHLGALGLTAVSVDAFPLVVRRPEDAFGLPTWPATWRQQGGFTDEEPAEWHAALERPADGFLYVVTVLVVAGTVS